MGEHGQVAADSRGGALFFLVRNSCRNLVPTLTSHRWCDFHQSVRGEALLPPLQLMLLERRGARFCWQDFGRAPIQQLGNGVLFRTVCLEMAAFTNCRFGVLRPSAGVR